MPLISVTVLSPLPRPMSTVHGWSRNSFHLRSKSAFAAALEAYQQGLQALLCRREILVVQLLVQIMLRFSRKL